MLEFINHRNATTEETFTLNGENIDRISKKVYDFALTNKVDSKSANRYSFLIDNALFRWSEKGMEGKEITAVFVRRFFGAFVELKLAGEQNDPYEKKKDVGFTSAENFIINVSLAPEYSYNDGVNVLKLRLLKERNMIATICIVLLAAILVGILGNLLLPVAIIETILSSLLSPFLDTFYDLLRCIAGPMVFLSVAWGICGIGDSRVFGFVGKKVMLFCLTTTFLGACISALCFPIFHLTYSNSASGGAGFGSLIEMILDIVPSTIIEPFATGNTLQIIFLAVAVGIALIVLSEKVKNVVTAVNQINHVIQYLMGFISKLVPFIVFLMVVRIIWNHDLAILTETWKLFLAMLLAFIVIAFFLIAKTAITQKVNPWLLIKKNLTTFMISLTTASSAAAFGSNMKSARKKYGIDENMAGFSIPLGIIAHNPIAAGYNMLIIMYAAGVYGIGVSLSWFIIGLFVSTVVAISSPPIPGGAAVCYAMLLIQMGLPEEALTALLIVDVLTDFFVTAFETYLLPISLTKLAGDLCMLDKRTLRNGKK